MRYARIPAWVWAVLVGIHLLAFGWVLHGRTWNFPDSDRYLQAAENIWQHGELYARPWPGRPVVGQAVQEFTIRPVGYPLVVLGLGGTLPCPVGLLLLQNGLSLFNLGVVLGWWARWKRPKTGEWWLAIVAIASFPAQVIYANALMSEILLQTAVVAMVGAGFLFIEVRQNRYLLAVAAALVVAMLLKPVFYPLTIGVAGVGMLLAWRFRRLAIALIGLIPLGVAGAYMGWNEQRTGYFHFSSIAEINALHYNAAGVVRQVDGPETEEKWVAEVLREANAEGSFAARQQLIRGRAGAVLWAHRGVYARQHLLGMATLFLDPGRFDMSRFWGWKEPVSGGLLAQVRAGGLWRAVGRLPWGMLATLGLMLLANGMRLVLVGRGFLVLGHGGSMLRYGRWLAVGILGYVALLTGPLGAARFLVPVWPLLLGLGLAGGRVGKAPIGLHPKQAPPMGEGQG